jgi:hypothetical protein
MPNWLPSFDRPSATRVIKGSAFVAALLTLGRGATAGRPGPDSATSGVDGPESLGPKVGVAAGARGLAGGMKAPPLPPPP